MLEFLHFSPQNMLVLSLVALLAGPVLFYFTRFSENFLKGLDGFVLVAICGMVFLHILPHTVQEIGWVAIMIILASLVLPTLIERVKSRFAASTHTFTLILALLGIALHAFTDGMALNDTFPTDGTHSNMLPLAIILHRIPDGLTIWWLLRPIYGNWAAVRTLAIMAIATVLGYFLGQIVFSHLSHTGVGIFEAIVGGSLLHVIFHHQHPMRKIQASAAHRWQWAAGLGALIAIVSIAYLTLNTHLSESSSYLKDTLAVLKTLALESAPALLFAYFFSGLIQTYLPHGSAQWLKRGNTVSQAFKGMVFGLPLPICSCGVIPVYRSLILQGAPLAGAIAFFVATPELSVDAFLLSIPLLGTQYTILRLIFAALVALTLGIVIHKIGQKYATTQMATLPVVTDENKAQGYNRFKQALRHGFGDAVDDTGPWIFLGLLIAALMEPFLKTSLFGAALPDYLEVPLFALLGMPLYVCASGATPLVAILVHNGISPGAGLAFLLTGPATNATTFAMLNKYHGKRIAISFAIGMAILSVSSGLIFNAVYNVNALPELFAHTHSSLGILQQWSLAILAILFTASLLRRGPRNLINEVMSFEDEDGHNHDHSHEHNHGMGTSCCAPELDFQPVTQDHQHSPLQKHKHDSCCH